MICAGDISGRKSPCSVDIGGPLVHLNDGAATLLGVVSLVENCAGQNMTVAATDVVHYLDWISENRL